MKVLDQTTSSHVDYLLEQIGHALQLSDSQYRDAQQKYESVAGWLSGKGSPLTSLNPKGTLKAKTSVTAVATGTEIRKFSLSNGATLLVREDPRLPLVSVQSTFLGGLLGETESNSGITSLMSNCLVKGTSTRDSATRGALAERSARRGGSVGPRPHAAPARPRSHSFAPRVLAPPARA